MPYPASEVEIQIEIPQPVPTYARSSRLVASSSKSASYLGTSTAGADVVAAVHVEIPADPLGSSFQPLWPTYCSLD